MAHQPPAGGAGYPGQGYPPQQGGYPPQATSGYGAPQQGGYPPQGGAPQYGAPQQGGYPPQGGAPQYGAPQQGGYPPQGGAPQYGAPQQGGYPPQGGAPQYGAPQQGGYPPHGGAPPPWQQSLAQTAQQQEIADLQRYFSSMDRDKSGSITANELMGVSFGGQKFSLDTARRLVKIFDRDQSGNIGFQEYVALHKFIQSMQAAFRAFDADRSGRLEFREVEQALSQGGFRFQSWVVTNLMKKFDKLNKGSLDFEQYIQMCAFLGALRSTFEMLDANRTGMVSLNLEQVVNIAANLAEP